MQKNGNGMMAGSLARPSTMQDTSKTEVCCHLAGSQYFVYIWLTDRKYPQNIAAKYRH
jgi:hypothetical protein